MKSTPAPAAVPATLGPALTLLLATATGLAVASIYYVQPLLGLLSEQFGVGSAAIGLLPTLTQLGYGAAILLLSPLGDRFDRRRIIVVKAGALVAALALAALAPGFAALCVASVVIGLTATLAQDLVPAAATLAPEAQRGKRVGQVMTGLLLGILLSRVAAGSLAALAGWRAVYASAAVAVALLIPLLWRALPRFVPATQAGYGALLASMVGLWRQHAPLRRAAWAQGLLSVAFSAFWSTLALVLAGPDFGQGSAVAGAFGLAGAAGALAAPLAGGMADRRGPQAVIRVAALLVFLSFAVQALAPASLALLWGWPCCSTWACRRRWSRTRAWSMAWTRPRAAGSTRCWSAPCSSAWPAARRWARRCSRPGAGARCRLWAPWPRSRRWPLRDRAEQKSGPLARPVVLEVRSDG